MSEVAYDPPDTAVEQDDDDEEEKYVYPDIQPIEEQRRAFVFKWMADAEISGLDPEVLTGNMQAIVDWLATGDVKRKPKLKAIK